MPRIPQAQRSLVMACYTVHLAVGETLTCRSIKAKTMKQYLRAVEELSYARNVSSPLITLNGERSKYVTRILNECQRWEDIPNKREPVTNEMMAYIVGLTKKDTNKDSRISAVADWLVMGEYGGFRKSEWAQDKRDVSKGRFAKNIDDSAKAFLLSDFRFRKDKRNVDATATTLLTDDGVDQVYLKWRFQKNGNNGEELPFSRNDKTPDRCFVRSALRARDRAQRLGVPEDTPIAVFRDSKGKVKHISNEDVEWLLRHAAKKVHHVTDKKDLQRWSMHSIRVGACTRLQLLNKPDHFIQMRLRWKSEAWKDYLRNLPELADAQNEVINALAEELAAC